MGRLFVTLVTFLGIGDHVQCFYCDGGLKNWDPCDVPWAEHAKWFGNCSFLQLKLGKDFVNWVKINNSAGKEVIERRIQEIYER